MRPPGLQFHRTIDNEATLLRFLSDVMLPIMVFSTEKFTDVCSKVAMFLGKAWLMQVPPRQWGYRSLFLRKAHLTKTGSRPLHLQLRAQVATSSPLYPPATRMTSLWIPSALLRINKPAAIWTQECHDSPVLEVALSLSRMFASLSPSGRPVSTRDGAAPAVSPADMPCTASS